MTRPFVSRKKERFCLLSGKCSSSLSDAFRSVARDECFMTRRKREAKPAISNLRRPFTTVVDRHGRGRIVYSIVYIVPGDVSSTIFDLWFWDAAKAETRAPGASLRTSGPRESPPPRSPPRA